MPVDIVDDQGKPLMRTRISFISPHVDTDSQTLLVKSQVPSRNGIPQRAAGPRARGVVGAPGPGHPVTAVSRLSGKLFAFVAEGQGQQAVARQRVIQVGDLIGNDYVVLDGINAGDKIIVTSVQMLADGMPVVPQILKNRNSPQIGAERSINCSISCYFAINKRLGPCFPSRLRQAQNKIFLLNTLRRFGAKRQDLWSTSSFAGPYLPRYARC